MKNSKIFSKQQYKVTTYFWGQSKRGDISSPKNNFPFFKSNFIDKKIKHLCKNIISILFSFVIAI
jgi:hypothetical protein